VYGQPVLPFVDTNPYDETTHRYTEETDGRYASVLFKGGQFVPGTFVFMEASDGNVDLGQAHDVKTLLLSSRWKTKRLVEACAEHS